MKKQKLYKSSICGRPSILLTVKKSNGKKLFRFKEIQGPKTTKGYRKWCNGSCQALEATIASFLLDIIDILDKKRRRYTPKYQKWVDSMFLEIRNEIRGVVKWHQK